MPVCSDAVCEILKKVNIVILQTNAIVRVLSTELCVLASSVDVPQEGDYFMLWFALVFRQRDRREKVIEGV